MSINNAIIIVLVLLGIWVIDTYNKLINSRIKVKEAFSTMDIFLKKRFDLIPNLTSIVKGYMDYESDVLTRITEARCNNISNSSKEQIDSEIEISNAVTKILMLVENYPELKADTQFLELQDNLVSIENDIEKSRRYYNGTVKHLNIQIQTIPNNIVAKVFGIKEEPFFEVNDICERNNVNINITNE